MPKLKPSTEELENRMVSGIIEKNMIIQGLSENDLAKKLGVSLSTIYNWKSNPDTMSLFKLRMICKILKIPNWEKVQMI